MSDFMTAVIGFGVAILVLLLQQILSRRENAMFGGIFPILTLIFAIGTFYFGKLTLSIRSVLPFICMIVIQISIWEDERKKFKEKKKLELNKMKSKDL